MPTLTTTPSFSETHIMAAGQFRTSTQRRKDYTGNRYGRLICIRFDHIGNRSKSFWLCRCDCGKEAICRVDGLISGIISSCGCYGKEKNSEYKDLTNRTFGRLVVIKAISFPDKPRIQWLCRCKCGNEVIVRPGSLASGHAKSCGCLQKEKAAKQAFQMGKGNITHDGTRTSEWLVWKNMRSRCTNPNTRSFPRYGGRGIKVCERWSDFQNFKDDMGCRPSPKHSLDRIDNNGHYEPGNCRWATQKQQQRNRTSNTPAEYLGENRPISEWAEMYGLTTMLLWRRLKMGWPIAIALFWPVAKNVKADAKPWRKYNGAHSAVRVAVASGKLVKPSHCEYLGCTKTPIEAHHYLGYEKAHHLDVVWLCRKHHGEASRKWLGELA